MKYLILLYPWIELFTLIQLGVDTSAVTALVYVFATILFGIALIRYQGLALISDLKNAQKNGEFFSRVIGKDFWIILAGLLFIIPGLVSDFVAMILFIVSFLPHVSGKRLDRKHRNESSGIPDSGLVIDGSFTHVDEASRSDH